MAVQQWEHFFKPEIRSSGGSLFSKGKVSLAQPSELEIVGYIRMSSPSKVILKTNSITSTTLFAECNCPIGKRNQLCKHIWAVLLAAEEKNADFFENKVAIETVKSAGPSTIRSTQTIYKEQQKEKQSLYRKIQYQKQKLRMKDRKKEEKVLSEPPAFPSDVEKALNFFSQNGFEIRESMNKEAIGIAKKKLSRVFHPDRGGSHEEILELNGCSDVLLKFVNKLNDKANSE